MFYEILNIPFYETLQEYSGEGISCLMNTEDMEEKRYKKVLNYLVNI